MNVFSDCEILYGVENLKNKMLRAKTGIVKRKKKLRRSNKRKSVTSNNGSSVTDVQKQNRVNY